MGQKTERHHESMKQLEEQTTGRRAAPPGHCAAPPALCAPPPPYANEFVRDSVKRVTQSVRASDFPKKWEARINTAADQATELERLCTLMRRLRFQGYVSSGPRIKHPRRALKSLQRGQLEANWSCIQGMKAADGIMGSREDGGNA